MVDRKGNEMVDFHTKVKVETLWQMSTLVDQMQRKLAILDAVDRDTTHSGSYDLTDQITNLHGKITAIVECIERSKGIVGEAK